MRALLPAILPVLAACFAAGCSCGLEDAAEISHQAAARQRAGMAREAAHGFAEAGGCVESDLESDPQARYVVAAVCYRLHLLGAPEVLAGDEAGEWALRRVAESGDPDFMAYAFRNVLLLESLTFGTEGIPAWATVDRLLVAADIVRDRSATLPGQLSASDVRGIPAPFVENFLKIGALEAVRGFAVQAWRRALDAGVPPDAARDRLAASYSGMADACAALAAADVVGPRGREWLRAERDRCTGLAERVRLVITPDDLRDPVEREMFKLDVRTHIDEGRRFALDAFSEKQSGNRARAVLFLRQACAHFALAFAIGIEEDVVRRGVAATLGELLPKFVELMAESE